MPTNVQPDKQKRLELHFIKPLANPILPSNILIKEGERVTDITVEAIVATADPEVIEIQLSDRGNFSIYTLCLRKDQTGDEFMDGFDKILTSLDFSFKVECDTDVDCKPSENDCSEVKTDTPTDINYLAKDYASFRQLMLDRMSATIPGWTERNASDLGITLVELISYVGDYLSYRQDAIGTEAYLGTARKRISVRRHARLVDYQVHEGLNARTWINLEVKPSSDGVVLSTTDASGNSTKFLTKALHEVAGKTKISQIEFAKKFKNQEIVFEPLHDLELYSEHNEISFHTYGDHNCCLPQGATQATLEGTLDHLEVGHVLIFAEILGAETGVSSDADPSHRHAIRVTEIERNKDFDFSTTPATPIDIAIIHWSEEDKLPFPLCISSSISIDDREKVIEVSIAKGNTILVDHGMTFTDEDKLVSGIPFDTVVSSLNPIMVPENKFNYVRMDSGEHCLAQNDLPIPPRFYPELNKKPITQSQSLIPFIKPDTDLKYLPVDVSAKKLVYQNKRMSTPDLELIEIKQSGISFKRLDEKWLPVQDLLIDSSAQDRHFVLETETDGIGHIRFGNSINGKKPETGSKFIARYRIGNGILGNVGRDTIHQVVFNDTLELENISNPLLVSGGIEPESLEEVRQYAPQAFRSQERAVTSADYEVMTRRCKEDVHSATAAFRWTGSWRTAFITADRLEGEEVDQEWENELRFCLEKYRMAGVDLEIDEPHYVGLDIQMEICIYNEYFRIDVKREILRMFSNRTLTNGRLGIFHPDNFTFGQPVYLSQLYHAAQSIDGVSSVNIPKFEKQGIPNSSGLKDGFLTFGRQEISRLDNDPNFKDRGLFTLKLKGGR